MLKRLAITLCVAVNCLPALADDAATGRQVVIVLDASRHMGGSLSSEATPGEPRWTRLGAAREAVSGVLSALASEEKHAVTLVLTGHRLAAQENEGETATVPQQEYLRLSGGKFERLAPGQDVEIVRESRPLTESNLADYQATLSALKPWGEAPLLLAIERAVELAPTDKSAGQTQIVVLTGGEIEGNGDAQHLLSTLQEHHAAVSIVHLGNAQDDDGSRAELRQIASESGGEFYQPTTAGEVARAARAAASREEPRRFSTLAPQPVTAVFQEPPPASSVLPVPDAGEQIYDIVFDVTYYGMPVKDAEVIIHGDNFDLIYNREAEYDRPSLRANRASGRYLFKGVPLGSYTMEITANVKNRKYQVIRGFSADDDNKIPGTSFKIQLEKSKDVPPPPPAAP
jgi:hypothetical protein